MEAAPPSYDKATSADGLDIIATYLTADELCFAALTCRRWHAAFAPHLWGNPGSHFGLGDERAYAALTKFKRRLRACGLTVRSMTHTLYLPSSQAELYQGFRHTWLLEVFDQLPHLQSLIVRGLPYFDYPALQALNSTPRQRFPSIYPNAHTRTDVGQTYSTQGTSSIPSTLFGLRLLDASRAGNLTSEALSQALVRFDTLLYLDLSFTKPARSPIVLTSLRRFSGIQVLKLRGIDLNDDALRILSTSIGRRVRSLDLRNNQISDHGLRFVIENCVMTTDDSISNHNISSNFTASLPRLGSRMLNVYQGEGFEGFLRRTLTTAFVGRLALEDLPEGGITHLYLSGNSITSHGATDLIRFAQLYVLDLGDVFNPANYAAGQKAADSHPKLPDLPNLFHHLAQSEVGTLTFFRVNHNFVTHAIPKDMQYKAIGETSLINERTRRLSADTAGMDCFHPAMLPTVRTLVLTDVPTLSGDRRVSHRLIRFIEQCAEEHWMALRHGRLDYSVPPGRIGCKTSIEESARRKFALRRIVLEMAPMNSPSSDSALSEGWSALKSVTEDPDSENLWSAAEADFSFFSSEKEHDRPYVEPTSINVPHFYMKEKSRSIDGPSEENYTGQLYDTLAILSSFRQERKRVYEQGISSAGHAAETPGYWDGVIQIVRPKENMRAEEEADYLGNSSMVNHFGR